jgi:hypothetical protein
MNCLNLQELACKMLDLDYDTLVNEGREDEIDNVIYEKLETGKVLIKFTPVLGGGLTDTKVHAFGEVMPNGGFCAIVKKEVEDE